MFLHLFFLKVICVPLNSVPKDYTERSDAIGCKSGNTSLPKWNICFVICLSITAGTLFLPPLYVCPWFFRQKEENNLAPR